MTSTIGAAERGTYNATGIWRFIAHRFVRTGFPDAVVAPDLLDLSNEPAHVLEMYGIDSDRQNHGSSGQLFAGPAHGGARRAFCADDWMLPGTITSELNKNLQEELPEGGHAGGGLLTDLKQRGLLDETLVVWGGEFGRTPIVETAGARTPRRRQGPSSARLHDVAGRRRHQRRPDDREDGRFLHEPWKTRFTSTTFRRRYCIAWGLIIRSFLSFHGSRLPAYRCGG